MLVYVVALEFSLRSCLPAVNERSSRCAEMNEQDHPKIDPLRKSNSLMRRRGRFSSTGSRKQRVTFPDLLFFLFTSANSLL